MDNMDPMTVMYLKIAFRQPGCSWAAR